MRLSFIFWTRSTAASYELIIDKYNIQKSVGDGKKVVWVGEKLGYHQQCAVYFPSGRATGSIVLVKDTYGGKNKISIEFLSNIRAKSPRLAILSTDLTIDAEEIVRIYGMRWSIETFFKFTKSYLKLGTEFQGRSFDMLISHTTVVFNRYLVMEFERRQENDPKSLGGLFFLFADEVRDLDYQTALQQLITLFLQMAETKTIKDKSIVSCQLREWISGLPAISKVCSTN